MSNPTYSYAPPQSPSSSPQTTEPRALLNNWSLYGHIHAVLRLDLQHAGSISKDQLICKESQDWTDIFKTFFCYPLPLTSPVSNTELVKYARQVLCMCQQ